MVIRHLRLLLEPLPAGKLKTIPVYEVHWPGLTGVYISLRTLKGAQVWSAFQDVRAKQDYR